MKNIVSKHPDLTKELEFRCRLSHDLNEEKEVVEFIAELGLYAFNYDRNLNDVIAVVGYDKSVIIKARDLLSEEHILWLLEQCYELEHKFNILKFKSKYKFPTSHLLDILFIFLEFSNTLYLEYISGKINTAALYTILNSKLANTVNLVRSRKGCKLTRLSM